MEYRRSDDGLLRVSEIGLGTYGLAGVYGRKDLDQFKRVVLRALDLGVTFFDTAPAYGDAEEIIGGLLGDSRKEVVISTKVAAGLGSDLSCSGEAVVTSCDESLRRLGTDYIDLFEIHFDDGKTPVEEVVRAFEHLKSEGKIRACGIGHVSRDRAWQYVRQGGVTTVMGELNAVSRRYHKRMLPLLRSSGAGYVGFSLTGRGILTGALSGTQEISQDDIRHMDAVFSGQRLKAALRIRDRFAEVGAELGATAAQMAIRWALGQEGVLTGLIGPSSVEHLEENLKAGDLEMPDSLKAVLGNVLDEEDERLTGLLREEVGSILAVPVSGCSAAPQLIYAIEGLAELELAPEHELVDHIRSVIRVMKMGEQDPGSLEALRKELFAYVSSR
jgi:aryl-alcohol dehydrogenase-like predicted oxidoreductase